MKFKENKKVMNKLSTYLYSIVFIVLIASCQSNNENQNIIKSDKERIPVIFDTDANNELDDQHALAYLVFNTPVFDLKGITVNATYNGGDISGHMQEAERVLKLCNVHGRYPLLKGANNDFEQISGYNNLD